MTKTNKSTTFPLYVSDGIITKVVDEKVYGIRY